MHSSKATFTLAALLCGLFVFPAVADAQVGRIKRAVQKKVEKKVEKMIGDAVACALDDTECVEQAKKDGKEVVIVDDEGTVITDENGNPTTDPEEAAKRAQQPGEGVWRNYDFTPGEVVWFASDFTEEPVGRFPASQLAFVRGNMQIVELNGEKVLEASANSVFRVNLPEELPEDFTLEFYLRIGVPNQATQVFFTPIETGTRYEGQYLRLYQRPGVWERSGVVSNINGVLRLSQELTPVKFQVDGDYAILYVGMERASNVPNANFRQSNAIEFQLGGNARLRSYIKDIVVAVGLDDLYDALMEDGEFTTRGIYFDVDMDVLRPESTPVLEEIRTTMEGHPDIEILIEGHTDNTGDDGHNQDLSERRAQSVVNYLVAQGIDGARLEAVGKGESEPVADNDTPQGRRQNRRVVIKRKQ